MKKIATLVFLLCPAIAQAVLPIASPNEPCMWPWTQPNVAPGTMWEASRCTSDNPYKRSCKKEFYHILSENNGYVKYRLTYWNAEGQKRMMDDSRKAKFLSCSYTSFKKVDSIPNT